jgi:peptidoglycan/xylan/chitin deacetylase (PgdA/CDA1 family)
MALHVAGAAMLAIEPSAWPLVGAVSVADHAVLFAAGVLPRSRVLGPNLRRLPPPLAETGAVSLTFDDGPDPDVTPRVLDLLQGRGARASFFCIGARARQHPSLVGEIRRRGHEVENHTFTHPHHFAWLGPSRLAAEIGRAQEALGSLADGAPQWFRAPAGIRSPLLDPVLARQGLALASWTRRGFDAWSRDPDAVTRRLLRRIRGGDILLLHDGAAGGGGGRMVLDVLPRVLDALEARGLRSVPLPRRG